MPMPGWKESEEKMAAEMARQGYSGTQIAAVLVTKSRNAVIGKLHRMGVSLAKRLPATATMNGHGAARKKQSMLVRRMLGMRNARLNPKHRRQVSSERSHGVEFLDLRSHHCRWPYGENGEFWFCGRDKFPHSPYCLEHFKVSRRQSGA